MIFIVTLMVIAVSTKLAASLPLALECVAVFKVKAAVHKVSVPWDSLVLTVCAVHRPAIPPAIHAGVIAIPLVLTERVHL